MEIYDHKIIESKWQKIWQEQNLFSVLTASNNNKKYILDMFPYPSAQGLHVGHPEGYTATDIYSRYLRLKGFNVLHPMGWDAFGLPAENYAIKIGGHPRDITWKNIDNFRSQIQSLGFSYDWSREVNTADPNYYKWTQWLFLELFKRGLAYQKQAPVNWCSGCQTVLANEQVVDSACERCGTQVEQRQMKQWFFKITDYAERLLADLEGLDWPSPIVEMQKNWIGKSEGADVKFLISNSQLLITIFTTRLDTIFGATYLVLAPEHALVQELKSSITNWAEVEEYLQQTSKKTELERQASGKEKTGVELKGVKAINPANGEDIPVWVADYVLVSYGTGAIMAVPAHDERDWEFAQKFGMPTKPVVKPFAETRIFFVARSLVDGWKDILVNYKWNLDKDGDLEVFIPDSDIEQFIPLGQSLLKDGPYYFSTRGWTKLVVYKDKVFDIFAVGGDEQAKQFGKSLGILHNELDWSTVFVGAGVLCNSKEFDGTDTESAKHKIAAKLGAKLTTKYRLRDWLVSRQRYWGAPIPIIYCEQCKNKKYKFVLLHGRRGSSSGNFFPWLWDYLVELGYQVFCPDLPNTANPKVEEQADFVINNIVIDEDTVILGHSLGGPVALKVLEKTGAKPARVLLIDSPLRPEFNDKDRPDLKQNFNWQFDFSKIKTLSEFIIIVDNNFPVVPKDQSLEYTELLGATRSVYVSPQEGHFCGTVEPEIIKYLVSDDMVPVPTKDLPVVLPDDVDFKPTGESPLARSQSFHNVVCPKCGAKARRESDTMDTFVDSSWYFLRYCDPQNSAAAFAKQKVSQWCPVDLYMGGAEHAVLHLLYSRFITKVLADAGYIDFQEPFVKLRNQGLILGEDGQKMSKSKGNVVNPDEVISEWGADSMRLYEMFLGPLEDAKPWSTKSIVGVRRFLERVWRAHELVQSNNHPEPLRGEGSKNVKDSSALPQNDVMTELEKKIIDLATSKVTTDIEEFKFNTAISALMTALTSLINSKQISREAWEQYLILLFPFAPHIAEELWQKLGHQESIFKSTWPQVQGEIKEERAIMVQVNGKVRGKLENPAGGEAEIVAAAKLLPIVAGYLEGKEIVKTVYVEGKMVSLVVK